MNRKKHLAPYLRWILITFVALIVVGFVSTRFSSGTDSYTRSIRQAGLPTNLEELDRWLPQIAASNNAALLILEAADKRIAPSGTIENLLPFLSTATDLAETKDDFEAYIEKNKETLDLVHRAAGLPGSRYPLNLTNTFAFQYLGRVKALANLLKAEAVYHSRRGQTDLALRSVTSGFALADTLRREPAIISELVRIACVAISLDTLEQLLPAQKWSRPQLTSVAEMLDRATTDGKRGAFGALVSERAIILSYFNLPPSEFNKLLSGDAAKNITEKLKMAGYRIFNIRERDQRLFLELMEKLSTASTNSFPVALRRADEVDREIDRRLSSGFGRFAIVSPVLHSMHKVIEREAALLTRLRCARAALAIETFRLDHGGILPANLNDLVPAYVPEFPTDPAAGEPLEFELLNSGYQISSPAAAARLKNFRTTMFKVTR